MDWIAIGTLIAVSVGAVAGIWTARETRRMARLQEQGMRPAEPAITVGYLPAKTRPDVQQLHISVRNRADIDLDLVSLSSPWRSRLGFQPHVTALGGQKFGGDLEKTEPETWPTKIDVPCTLQAGSDRNIIQLRVYTHRRSLPVLGTNLPVVCLEMRWRNNAVTTFITQVTATPISTA